MADWVWMRNKETGGRQRFAAEAVDEWKRMGWEESEPPAEPNLALDPNHPALVQAQEAAQQSAMAGYASGMRRAAEMTRQKFTEPAPEGGEAFVPKRGEGQPADQQTTDGPTPPANKRSTGRASAADKEE